VTVLLPIDAVGLMIGKGGQTLKRLLEEGDSACAIRVQDYQEVRAGSKERGIILRGSFEAIENVERAMIDLLRHRRQKAVDAKREREEVEGSGPGEAQEGTMWSLFMECSRRWARRVRVGASEERTRTVLPPSVGVSRGSPRPGAGP
jgi:hypothetical protein